MEAQGASSGQATKPGRRARTSGRSGSTGGTGGAGRVTAGGGSRASSAATRPSSACTSTSTASSPSSGGSRSARHLDLCGPCVGAYGFEAELRKVIANRCKDHVPDALIERVAKALHNEHSRQAN